MYEYMLEVGISVETPKQERLVECNNYHIIIIHHLFTLLYLEP